MIVYAPGQPGRYILRVTMVQENVAWFEDRGAKPLDIPVLVTITGEVSLAALKRALGQDHPPRQVRRST